MGTRPAKVEPEIFDHLPLSRLAPTLLAKPGVVVQSPASANVVIDLRFLRPVGRMEAHHLQIDGVAVISANVLPPRFVPIALDAKQELRRSEKLDICGPRCSEERDCNLD